MPKRKTNQTKKDTAKKDTAKKDTAKKDTAKKDTAKKDTAKKDTAKKDTAKKEEKVIEQEPDVSDVEETVNSTEDNTKQTKKRLAPTRDSVLEGFDDILTSIEDEISKLRENPVKSKGVRYLRSMAKKIRNLKNKSGRVMKKKREKTTQTNVNSGFNKPVKISKELSEFAGWDKDELKSRVDVTKYICQYIRDHNLQNKDDRREIEPNKELSKLLDYDPKTASVDKKTGKKALRYYSLQTYLRKHYEKA